MTSLFDSLVYQARTKVEWAEIDLEYFLKDITGDSDGGAQLTVHSRPSVSTRFWWSLTWKSEDGEQHTQDASTLQLCLWRAAIREKQIREKIERQSQKEREGI